MAPCVRAGTRSTINRWAWKQCSSMVDLTQRSERCAGFHRQINARFAITLAVIQSLRSLTTYKVLTNRPMSLYFYLCELDGCQRPCSCELCACYWPIDWRGAWARDWPVRYAGTRTQCQSLYSLRNCIRPHISLIFCDCMAAGGSIS